MANRGFADLVGSACDFGANHHEQGVLPCLGRLTPLNPVGGGALRGFNPGPPPADQTDAD